MSSSVLVGYATQYGSTQEVAEAIAETLRESGLEVDLQPARDVRDLAEYTGVVLGAPLMAGRWHKDAQCLLSRHREALAEMPVDRHQQIARAGRQVGDLQSTLLRQDACRPAPPGKIAAQAQEMVEEIVGRCDPIEHRADGNTRRALCPGAQGPSCG